MGRQGGLPHPARPDRRPRPLGQPAKQIPPPPQRHPTRHPTPAGRDPSTALGYPYLCAANSSPRSAAMPTSPERASDSGNQHRRPGGAGNRAERLGKCREDFTPDAVKWADALRIAALSGGASLISKTLTPLFVLLTTERRSRASGTEPPSPSARSSHAASERERDTPHRPLRSRAQYLERDVQPRLPWPSEQAGACSHGFGLVAGLRPMPGRALAGLVFVSHRPRAGRPVAVLAIPVPMQAGRTRLNGRDVVRALNVPRHVLWVREEAVGLGTAEGGDVESNALRAGRGPGGERETGTEQQRTGGQSEDTGESHGRLLQLKHTERCSATYHHHDPVTPKFVCTNIFGSPVTFRPTCKWCRR